METFEKSQNEDIVSINQDEIKKLKEQIEQAENHRTEKMREMKNLISTMLAALKRQPNVNNSIKQGLPKLEEMVDSLETMSRRCVDVKRLIVGESGADKRPLLQRPRSSSLSAIERGKRPATSPPLQLGNNAKKKKDDSSRETESIWTEVVGNKKRKRQKRKNKEMKLAQSENPKPVRTNSAKRQRRKTKPDAILLKPAEGKTYADIVGAIHANVKPSEMGIDVKSVRRTKSGGVLLELGKSTAENRATFSKSLTAVVGKSSSVTELTPTTQVEIRDCDCCTTVAEIEEAVIRTLPDYKGIMKVKLTRPNSREQRLALVKVEEPAAEKILEVGRLIIGFVSCRVRRSVQIQRCFRCLDYGHYSTNCKGPDRSKLCYRCGKSDHKGAHCTAEPSCFLCAPNNLRSAKHSAGSRICAAFKEALNKIKSKC